ncbi:EI24 domain-containing protein [Aromatoleum anaerobium]|uniref:Transmembrane protein n=1 Tax=Aromatoleum anaerobium TaxID=182180 RepID=A0ABX1PQS6_9RHOO|nr:EI24 domain-containing protein [Aromatoleum anaerobium]MCK0509167.1 EI24 domain-containing protein [Aromatoleum anaerobium]
MSEILIAFGRALRSLTRRGVLVHLLWPGLVALLLWIGAAVFLWTPAVEGVMAWIDSWAFARDWLTGSEIGAATVLTLVKIALVLALLPLVYVTAALLVAVFALPMILERVATRDYADLERRKGGSNLGSAWNALVAGLLFLLGLLVSLPFWLIPGVGIVVSLVLTAWLNQRAFGYDALMLHADREELARLPRVLRPPMLLLGGGCALLAYVPLVNLLAPAFCGLAFVHFMLESLRRERIARGVTVLDALPGAPS